MGNYTTIDSEEQLDTLLSENRFVLLDFWAVWCGPCKVIAPIFEQLAEKSTVPNSLVFAKVDVDTQAEIAKRFSISAMPTFLLLENGEVAKTTRGANPPALRNLVTHARNELKKQRKEKGEEDVSGDEEEEPVPSISKADLLQLALAFLAVFAVVFAVMFYKNPS